VIAFQKGFVAVLEYAGVFVSILIGIVPIMMTWSARYIQKLHSPYRAFGGRPALIAGFVLYLFIIALVVANNVGFMTVDVSKYLS
jgi:amino acid permease